MPIADAEQIGDHAIAGTAADVCVHDVGRYAVRATLARMILAEEVVDTALCGEHLGHRHRVNVLHDTVLRAGGQTTVRRQFEVQVLAPQQFVHQRYHLQNELILPQIVAVLEEGHVLLVGRRYEAQSRGNHKK